MKKHRKKIIIGIIFLIMLIGAFGVVTFSPKIADMFQKAVAQNEGEGDTVISSDEAETTEENTTEVNENVLTLEDTNYAVVAGAESDGTILSTVENVESLNKDTYYKIYTSEDWKKLQQ